jgi:fructose-bisphosphate aldolase class I
LGQRFATVSIACTDESRRDYRELLFTAEGLNKYIAGVITHEETLGQVSRQDGTPLIEALQKNDILIGVKVDKGLVPLNNFAAAAPTGEFLTQGIDDLAERLIAYKAKGASFAKWRAVYGIGAGRPSNMVIRANADSLALYAAICQSQGIVPIVEPEVLLDGDNSIEVSADVTCTVLLEVFAALRAYGVMLEFIILKPNMVLAGKKCPTQPNIERIAIETLMVLRRSVPAIVPSINFLSGGQTAFMSTLNLQAMNSLSMPLPWRLSYSYARGLHSEAMDLWLGKEANISEAQQSLVKRAKLNSLASVGDYHHKMEGEI